MQVRVKKAAFGCLFCWLLMQFSHLIRQLPREWPSSSWLWLLLWLLAGIFGREPWKPDEATNLTWFMYFYQGGSWKHFLASHSQAMSVAPAGYFAVAAWCARALDGVFSPIVGGRLFNLPLFLVTLYASRATVQQWFGVRYANWVGLMLLAQLGLLLPTHLLVAENLLLCGLAVALWGMSVTRPLSSGLWLATGLLLIWLAKGFSAWLGLLLLSLLWPWWRREQNRAAVLGLGGGWLLASAVVWCCGQYFANAVSIKLLHAWYADNWQVWQLWWQPHADVDVAFYARTLLWFAWPSLPLSVWLWQRQRQFWQQHYTAAMRFAVSSVVVLLLQILCFGVERDIALLPVLLPLVWLAAVAVERLPRNLASASEWFAFLTFAVLSGGLWLMWLWGQYRLPLWLSSWSRHHIAPPLLWGAVLVALFYSGVWAWQVRQRAATGAQALVTWVAGLTLWWGLAMSLWLPWLDSAKSYRPLLLSAKAALPVGACVQLANVSPAVEGFWHYFTRVPVQMSCGWVLQQGDVLRAGVIVWQGKRSTDNSERFTLYRRVSD